AAAADVERALRNHEQRPIGHGCQVMRSLGSSAMEHARRRVLMLAYVFPPLAGGGVQRTLKFVRYLEPLGWDVTVISTRSRVYPARDPSLLREVPPGTRVIRTTAFPLGRWVGLVLHRLGLRRAFAWATWPDGGLGWAPFALLAGLRAALRERPD